MATIKQSDLIQSVADALQYISYYHPVDYITNLARAYELEQSPAAKDAMAQILINSRMCAEGHRPICQDTGIVTAFVKARHGRRAWEPRPAKPLMTVQQMVDEGVRRAYPTPTTSSAPASSPTPPAPARTPATTPPPSSTSSSSPAANVDITVAAKGGGSEAKSQVRHAQPLRLHRRLGAENRPHHGRRLVPARHARHRHRRHRRKSHAPGQESLMDPIDMQELIARGPQNQRSKNSASSSTTRSIASASAPRASAA